MPEAKPELVIFDLDGTLVDSIGDIASAMNSVLHQNGLPCHPVDRYRDFVGDGVEMLVHRALPPEIDDEKRIACFVESMRSEYSERLLLTTRPFPEIPELLTFLHSRGIQTAVLSNKPDGPTRTMVGRLFAEHPFAAVRGERRGVPRKPDPTSTLEIIGELGVRPHQTLLVGDTPIDIATALNAGTRPVGVTWGFRTAQQLVDAGADRIIDLPSDLVDLVDSMVVS
jgi:phosphoglycolate phosphatase